MYDGCDSSVSAADDCRANAERLTLSRTIRASVALMESTESGLRVDVTAAPSLVSPNAIDTLLDQPIVVAVTKGGKHNPGGDALKLRSAMAAKTCMGMTVSRYP